VKNYFSGYGGFFFVFLTILLFKTTLTLFFSNMTFYHPNNIKELSILCPICKKKRKCNG
ncbi:unnamed protein product, partial [Bubo scandiacus]